MDKKYILIPIFFIILGVGLLFFYRPNNESDIIEDSEIKEDINISSEEKEVAEEVAQPTPSINVELAKNPLEEKFNQEIVEGDKSVLNKAYSQAIVHYNRALSYGESQIAYVRLSSIYNVMGDSDKAIESIDKAIALKPSHADYWSTKIQLLDEQTDATYTDLREVYEEGIAKSSDESKINLVLMFARVSENNSQKDDAMSLWEYAIKLYPANTEIYQAEIDRIKG